MAAHLAHKIPWQSLCDMYVARRTRPLNHRPDDTKAELKTLAHIGRVIARTLQDFKRTATTTPDVLAVLDPRQWNIVYDSSRGGYTGRYDSLLLGYVQLNMLVTDPIRILPLFRDDRGECTCILGVLLGKYSGGHPANVADHLQQAFEGTRFKPLTAEVLQTFRDHAALLFRCMYLMTGENLLFDESFVIHKIIYW